MPAFVFLLFVTVLGATNVALLSSLGKVWPAVLVGLLTAQVGHLAWAFRPTTEVPEEDPREALLAMNRAFWEAANGPVTVVTMPCWPQFTEKCALPYCECPEDLPCYCAGDCNCPNHADMHDEEEFGFVVAV